MERRIVVPLPRGEVTLPLVPSSEGSDITTRENERIGSDELVALAQQLDGARDLVRGRALDRLNDIAEQVAHLHKMAKKVLEDANRDEELHKVACNMQKIVGKVYHLYERSDGVRYMSLLSPEEWAKPEKAEEFRGSYRLEADRSWLPIDEVEKKYTNIARFEHLLDHRSQASSITYNE